MNHGSWDIVTRFWKLSADSDTEAPAKFGVTAGFAGLVAFGFGVGANLMGIMLSVSFPLSEPGAGAGEATKPSTWVAPTSGSVGPP